MEQYIKKFITLVPRELLSSDEGKIDYSNYIELEEFKTSQDQEWVFLFDLDNSNTALEYIVSQFGVTTAAHKKVLVDNMESDPKSFAMMLFVKNNTTIEKYLVDLRGDHDSIFRYLVSGSIYTRYVENWRVNGKEKDISDTDTGNGTNFTDNEFSSGEGGEEVDGLYDFILGKSTEAVASKDVVEETSEPYNQHIEEMLSSMGVMGDREDSLSSTGDTASEIEPQIKQVQTKIPEESDVGVNHLVKTETTQDSGVITEIVESIHLSAQAKSVFRVLVEGVLNERVNFKPTVEIISPEVFEEVMDYLSKRDPERMMKIFMYVLNTMYRSGNRETVSDILNEVTTFLDEVDRK